MRVMLAIALTALAVAAPGRAAEPAKPLFASDGVIRLTISGPVDQLASGGPDSRTVVGGTIGQSGTSEALPVRLELRGITRRQRDVCQFPPLRVSFDGQPPASSLFSGQRRLKLVTHCRPGENFQQYLLLEYAAYRLFNQMTPQSFRVRLAQIDYLGTSGKRIAARYGFFIEDVADVAARNGMREAKMGTRFPPTRLEPQSAARFALFNYMIGNLDWAMHAGPAGDDCCHNSKPIGVGGSGAATLVPVPYDFDFSGFVDAPYATPPEGISVSGVKQRRYRGFCRDTASARSMLPAFRAQQGQVRALLASIPDLKAGVQAKAARYLDGFFADIATDAEAEARLFKTCLN